MAPMNMNYVLYLSFLPPVVVEAILTTSGSWHQQGHFRGEVGGEEEGSGGLEGNFYDIKERSK